MNANRLKNLFDDSPAVKLVRSTNAPYIIEFLQRQFKKSGRITKVHSEISTALREFQSELTGSKIKALTDNVETYLTTWCSSETRWLHRFLENDQPEPVYELTPESEIVLAFVDRMVQQDLGFVGTESRLKLVIDTLGDLAIGSSDDPVQRLEHLRSERNRIDQEIAAIEANGTVDAYRPAQIRERFSTAVGMLKQLQGDFRAVEERFRRITREVRQRQHQHNATRGGILQYALDAEDLIKQDDQGVSFFEFVRFILSPVAQNKLQTIVSQLETVDELASHQNGMDTVRRMIPALLAEAEKVMRTSQRLSTTLRRLLDTRSNHERKKVAGVLSEIRSLAASLANNPPEGIGIEVETNPEMLCPMAKDFWVEPAEFEHVDLTEHSIDTDRRMDAFQSLAELQRLDWHSMRTAIADSIAAHETPTLGMLFEDHPPKSGIVEVLGYLQIAHDDGHYISIEAEEEIIIPAADEQTSPLAVTVPLILFMVT